MFTDCNIAKERSSVYEKYQELKKEKGHLSLDMLTIEDLYQMWSEEYHSDSTIASLFDVKKEDIRRLRYKYDIKMQNIIAMKTTLALEEAFNAYRQLSKF